MTTLDKQAWEHVKSLLNEYDQSLVKKGIETYLAALPEARRAWGVKVNGVLRDKAYTTQQAANNRALAAYGHEVVPVEIREVRQP